VKTRTLRRPKLGFDSEILSMGEETTTLSK